MVKMAFVQLRKVSVGWALIGAAAGIATVLAHPLLATDAVRGAILLSMVGDVAEYLAFGIGAFALFWVVLHRMNAARQIARSRWPRLRQVLRELAFSISSQIVMAAVALYILIGTPQIMTNMMAAPDWMGWLWVAVLPVVLLVIDDAVFYWTHRAMHHPLLFRPIHALHHESHDPTPFTAFAFHPAEAVVQALNGLAIAAALLVLPWHPVALGIFGFCQIAFNVIGHLGYELYPAGWNRWPILRWKTPGLHHYLHHQMIGGNYALYFRWWDIWCGTELPNFEARYDRIFAAQSVRSEGNLDTLST
jgi:Delta7-sterol 5-desaturase